MRVGDHISWESQAQGMYVEKKGSVVAMIPKGESARTYVPKEAKKSHIKFDKDVSVYDRVLVAVPAGTQGQITHYYCPTEHMLRAQGIEV